MKKRYLLALLLWPAMAPAQNYQGDFYLGDTVRCWWRTFDTSGTSATRDTDGAVEVTKGVNTTETTTGVTDTEDFDGDLGSHVASIATTDSFYVTGEEYVVRIDGAVVDGQTIDAPLCTFSIENRDLKYQVKARGTATTGSTTELIELGSAAVSADDEFNFLEFWNVTTNERAAITDTDNANDTVSVYPPLFTAPSENDVWRIVASKSPQVTIETCDVDGSGNCYSNIRAISDDTAAADNLELQYDGTGVTGDNFPAKQVDLANAQSDLTLALADTDELQADWTDGGRLDLLLDAALADTGELQTDWANGGRLDLILDARASQASLDLAQLDLDALTDPPGEPAGVFNWATATLPELAAYIAAFSRNKVTQTATTKTLRNDADSEDITTCGVSDDGTTFTRAECQ